MITQISAKQLAENSDRLIQAAREKDFESVKKLIPVSDVKAVDQYGRTALMYAAMIEAFQWIDAEREVIGMAGPEPVSPRAVAVRI